LEPLPEQPRPLTPVDPSAIELIHTVEVVLDVTQLSQSHAGQQAKETARSLNSISELPVDPDLAPLLGVISRSMASALDTLNLTHFRVLVLLSSRDSTSPAALASFMDMNLGTLLQVLLSLERLGWVCVEELGRGVIEKVLITDQGRALVDRVTAQRQREIDAILDRMSDQDRLTVAGAFNSFADAAREPSLTNSTTSIP
jgi:DNA-binding MarR family transcriptional regulator